MVCESNLNRGRRFGIILWSYIREYFYPESVASRIGVCRDVGGSGPDLEGYRGYSGHHPFFSNAIKYRQGSYNQTYRGLIGLKIHRRGNYSLELRTSSGQSPNQLPFYTFAMENLGKRHKNEWSEWEKITSYVVDYNLLAERVLSRLRTIIGDKMRETYPGFREESGIVVANFKNENYYNLPEILKQAYNNKYEKEKTGHVVDFEFNNTYLGNRHLLRLPDQSIIIESDTEEHTKPEKLKDLLNRSFNDVETDIRRLASLYTVLEIDVEEFSQDIKLLSEKIEMASGLYNLPMKNSRTTLADCF